MSWLQQYEGTPPASMKKEDILRSIYRLIPPNYLGSKIEHSPIFSNKSRELFPEAVSLGFDAQEVLNQIVKKIEEDEWWVGLPAEVEGPDANPDNNPAYKTFMKKVSDKLQETIEDFVAAEDVIGGGVLQSIQAGTKRKKRKSKKLKKSKKSKKSKKLSRKRSKKSRKSIKYKRK